MGNNTAFAMWGHYQGIGAGLALFAGGIISYFYPVWYWSIYGGIVSLLLLVIEYFIPGGFPSSPSFLATNYLARALVYIALTPACYFSLPLHDGGIFLGLSGVTYLIGHCLGESTRDRESKMKKK